MRKVLFVNSIIKNYKNFYCNKYLSLAPSLSPLPDDKLSLVKKIKSKITDNDKKKVINVMLKSCQKISQVKFTPKCMSRLHKLVKPCGYCTYCFPVDYNVAENIAKTFLKLIKGNKYVIFETNPGCGLITYHLLKKNIDKLVILQENNCQLEILNDLINQNEDRNHVMKRNKNFFGTWKKANVFLDLLNELKLGKGEKYAVLGVTPDFLFVSQFVKAIVYRELHNNLNDIELYLIVGQNVYNNFKFYKRSYVRFGTYCMFHLFFNIEYIKTYSRNSFYPPSYQNDENMHFLRISSRKDRSEKISDDDIRTYYFFLKLLQKSRYKFVIETLEQWIPDCGPLLITKGLSIMHKIMDLNHEEATILFNLCKQCNSFNNLKIILNLDDDDVSNDNQMMMLKRNDG
ncbi:hypothetical protein Phum_PHUM513400 [Pediculus humanus corporis]|uniref:Uncharacterized protein n=1 Tax=Pediculus humanus subsp. corporis TaxID=121224 RepID=E0VYF1_PEDHC|nr:uncharacterized protein Phum_PHUM513400 [Pediculus humanus corporis]EEB18407.1 hypothetical protein Phum_PHUM513400 [Pediculus humanus corporis]